MSLPQGDVAYDAPLVSFRDFGQKSTTLMENGYIYLYDPTALIYGYPINKTFHELKQLNQSIAIEIES
jgi:hypothetical protein